MINLLIYYAPIATIKRDHVFGYRDEVNSLTNDEKYSVKPTDPTGLTDARKLLRHNTPVIFIGDDPRKGQNSITDGYEQHYFKIGEHDQLDLMHNIGHAFGLWNTHK